MKNIYIFLLLVLLISCRKESSVFKIEINYVDKNLVEDELKQIKYFDPPGFLYKDEKYEVWKSCSGEWGGTVYFKNKQTGIIHYAIATCPVSVNKIDGKYYVSNSLSHMIGFSDILEIADPEKMETTNKLPIFHPDIITREYEAKSHSGTKTLLDSSGISIATSFVYDKKLYSIISNRDASETTVSELKNNKFYSVAKLPEKLFYSEPIIIKESENHQKLYFQNPKSGVLEINNDIIKITYYKK